MTKFYQGVFFRLAILGRGGASYQFKKKNFTLILHVYLTFRTLQGRKWTLAKFRHLIRRFNGAEWQQIKIDKITTFTRIHVFYYETHVNASFCSF